MKRKKIFFLIIYILILPFFLKAQDVRLSFSSLLNCNWNPWDSVVVTNLSQNYYSTTLYYPDTVLELSTDVGITEFSSNEGLELLTFPNPFSGTAFLQLNLPQSGTATLILYDLLGRKLTQHKQHLPAGQHNFTLKSCPNGYYFLQINTPQGSVSTKLLSYGSTSSTIPVIACTGTQERKNTENRKLYDPDFPFNLNDYFYIRCYYKDEFLDYYNRVSRDVEYTASFFDSSTLALSPMQNILSNPINLFNSKYQYDTLYIVNDFETLSLLLGNKINEAPTIDFSTQSVILIQGSAPHQPAAVKKTFGKNSFEQYVLGITVIEGAATVPGSWHVGVITEKISNETNICLLIYYCDFSYNCY